MIYGYMIYGRYLQLSFLKWPLSWRELELGERFFSAAAFRLCQELLRIITRMNEWTICGIPFASWLKGGDV